MRRILLSSVAIVAMAFVWAAHAQDNMDKLTKIRRWHRNGGVPALCPRPANMPSSCARISSRSSCRRASRSPLCRRSRRPAYGGRAAGHRDLRRHPEGRRLGGYRPEQVRNGRRGEALRPVARPSPSRTASASPRTDSFSSPSATGTSSSRRRSSSTRARTWPSATWSKEGDLIPGADESCNHTARVCVVGPDNKLYVQLGQPFNVPPPEKYRDVQEARHRRHHPHGPGRHATARSMPTRPPQSRSAWISTRQGKSCGRTTIRWTAWATTSRRGSSTGSPRSGENFGFPWYGGGQSAPTIQGQ